MDERGLAGHNFTTTTHETPLLDPARERTLLVATLQGDADAASELVRSHTRLVLKIAARYRRSNLCWDDLVSEGVLGLLEAMRRFDLSQETRFSAYATWWIRARVGQYALTNRRLVRIPSRRGARSVARGLHRTEHRLSQRLGRTPTAEELADELGVDVADVTEVQSALSSSDLSLSPVEGQPGTQVATEWDTPEQAFERREQEQARHRCVRQALSTLSPRERQIVSEQYLDEQSRTLSELGADYGISRQRVAQVLQNARGKLKQALAQVA